MSLDEFWSHRSKREHKSKKLFLRKLEYRLHRNIRHRLRAGCICLGEASETGMIPKVTFLATCSHSWVHLRFAMIFEIESWSICALLCSFSSSHNIIKTIRSSIPILLLQTASNIKNGLCKPVLCLALVAPFMFCGVARRRLCQRPLDLSPAL